MTLTYSCRACDDIGVIVNHDGDRDDIALITQSWADRHTWCA